MLIYVEASPELHTVSRLYVNVGTNVPLGLLYLGCMSVYKHLADLQFALFISQTSSDGWSKRCPHHWHQEGVHGRSHCCQQTRPVKLSGESHGVATGPCCSSTCDFHVTLVLHDCHKLSGVMQISI